MENLTLHRPWTRAIPFGLRAWVMLVVTRTRHLPTSSVAGHSTSMTTEQGAPFALLTSHNTRPYPQRWMPVRPGLRVDAAPHLSPHGTALRAPLQGGAAAHLFE